MVVAVIVACEVGFWVLVGLGLLTRYALGAPRAGIALLAATPAVDLVLLAAVVANLRDGATASAAHGLAAIYLGASVAYGHQMITWVDRRVAHRLGRGPAPVKLYGSAYARHCWHDVLRTALATVIAAAIIWGLVAVVDDPARTEALLGVRAIAGTWFAVDLVWAVAHTLAPRREPAPTG